MEITLGCYSKEPGISPLFDVQARKTLLVLIVISILSALALTLSLATSQGYLPYIHSFSIGTLPSALLLEGDLFLLILCMIGFFLGQKEKTKALATPEIQISKPIAQAKEEESAAVIKKQSIAAKIPPNEQDFVNFWTGQGKNEEGLTLEEFLSKSAWGGDHSVEFDNSFLYDQTFRVFQLPLSASSIECISKNASAMEAVTKLFGHYLKWWGFNFEPTSSLVTEERVRCHQERLSSGLVAPHIERTLQFLVLIGRQKEAQSFVRCLQR